MKKKAYITPQSGHIEFRAESLLATSSQSISIKDDQQVDAGTSYSNKRNPWSSSNWSSSDDE